MDTTIILITGLLIGLLVIAIIIFAWPNLHDSFFGRNKVVFELSEHDFQVSLHYLWFEASESEFKKSLALYGYGDAPIIKVEGIIAKVENAKVFLLKSSDKEYIIDYFNPKIEYNYYYDSNDKGTFNPQLIFSTIEESDGEKVIVEGVICNTNTAPGKFIVIKSILTLPDPASYKLTKTEGIIIKGKNDDSGKEMDGVFWLESSGTEYEISYYSMLYFSPQIMNGLIGKRVIIEGIINQGNKNPGNFIRVKSISQP